MRPPAKNLVNERFGKLIVQSYLGNSKWLCLCSCGGTSKARTVDLNLGKIKGCKFCANRTEEAGLVGFNRVYSKYKRRGRNFQLTIEQFKNITQSNCHYCGIEPRQISTHSPGKKDVSEACKEHAKYIYNGIDKKDPEGGYTLDNCLPCCKVCNFSKKNMAYEDFISYLNRVTNFWSKNDNRSSN